MQSKKKQQTGITALYCRLSRDDADRLLDEWVRYTEQAVATCERAAHGRNGDLMDWPDMACRFRGQLRELRAVRTPAAVEVAA